MGSCNNMYMGYFWLFSVWGHFQVGVGRWTCLKIAINMQPQLALEQSWFKFDSLWHLSKT